MNKIINTIKNHKKLAITLLLLVTISIVYTVIVLNKPKTVEQPKVAETKQEVKDEKKTSTKEDKKSDEKKTGVKPEATATPSNDATVEETQNTTSNNVSNNTSTSTENTTSTTPVVPKNDTPKNTETTASNKSDNIPAPCVPTYITVNHSEQGHYETRVVKEAEYVPVYDRKIVGGQTGRVYNSLDEWGSQDEDYSYSVKTVQVGTEYHEAITEQVWVVDQPAYTTIEASGC
jgi:hypothetical protein